MGLNKDFFDVVQEARSTGEPIARYIKGIVGRVCVSVIDTFTKMPQDIVLNGIPGRVDDEEITLTMWTDFENDYFRRANKVLLRRGYIVPFTREIVEKISVNEVSDDILLEALGKPFFGIKALLDKFTSPVPVIRLLALAREMNKAVGTISAIEARLSELQRIDNPPVVEQIVEEL